MDPIRQALDIARGAGPGAPAGFAGGAYDGELDARAVQLSPATLEANRIVAHATVGPQARIFDMLRTQVLQEMDKHGWQFLAVTSATAGCGKTVTACNLAVGISRLAERSVLLVDLDLHRPSVSEYLGLGTDYGVVAALEGRAQLSSVLVRASFGPNSFLVLPGEVCKVGASEWMASQAMATLLQTIKREFRSRIVIFDLPPMLMSDDVISILPQMDAVLLVAAAGETSVADVAECQKHLKSTPVVRVALNRVAEKSETYYGYGYYR